MSFGPAWGHDGLSFNGKDMRQLAQSLGYGVTYAVMGQGDLAVTAQLTPANTVRVAAGRGLVNANGAGLTGAYHVWNDGSVTSPTFTATGADPRTDRVIVRVVAGVPTVQIVAGTPGPGTPPPPTVTGDNFMVLARVQIPAATSTVTNAMIVDERIVVGQPATRVLSAATVLLNPAAGDLNYEPDTGRLKMYQGGVWRTVSEAGAWQTYTPAFTNVVIGGGSTFGRYTEQGSLVTWRAGFTLGGAGNVSGLITVSLPPVTPAGFIDEPVQCWATDSSGGLPRFGGTGVILAGATTATRFADTNTSGGWDGSQPFNWESGDVLLVGGQYERAA